MAKPRKNYSYKKRPRWQWIVAYIIIGGIIYFMLYYSGMLNGLKIGSYNSNYSSDYNYIE